MGSRNWPLEGLLALATWQARCPRPQGPIAPPGAVASLVAEPFWRLPFAFSPGGSWVSAWALRVVEIGSKSAAIPRRRRSHDMLGCHKVLPSRHTCAGHYTPDRGSLGGGATQCSTGCESSGVCGSRTTIARTFSPISASEGKSVDRRNRLQRMIPTGTTGGEYMRARSDQDCAIEATGRNHEQVAVHLFDRERRSARVAKASAVPS